MTPYFFWLLAHLRKILNDFKIIYKSYNTHWTYFEHTLNILWTYPVHTLFISRTYPVLILNIPWRYPEHTLRIAWRYAQDLTKSQQHSTDSLTDSPTWIQEMLAHLKSFPRRWKYQDIHAIMILFLTGYVVKWPCMIFFDGILIETSFIRDNI